jgi:glutamate-1-semialdehyde 2,1-aminomutase
VIGGGMPVGALSGRRELMRHLSPEGRVYQAGTLSGNPIAMAAGLATLRVLERDGGWAALERLGARLDEHLRPVLARATFPARLVRLGSIFWLCLQEHTPRSAEAVAPDAGERYRPLFHALLDCGISLAPSAFEVGFLSLAHTEGDLERFAGALGAALGERE